MKQVFRMSMKLTNALVIAEVIIGMVLIFEISYGASISTIVLIAAIMAVSVRGSMICLYRQYVLHNGTVEHTNALKQTSVYKTAEITSIRQRSGGAWYCYSNEEKLFKIESQMSDLVDAIKKYEAGRGHSIELLDKDGIRIYR